MFHLNLKPFDLSGTSSPAFQTPGTDGKMIQSLLEYYETASGTRSKSNAILYHLQPFPPNTRGYLYFHVEENKPPITGELRFRICGNPWHFEQGHDLRGRNPWETWNISLFRLARIKQYAGIYHIIRRERLVPTDVLSDIQKLPMLEKTSAVLYDIGQPFVIDLSVQDVRFTLMHPKYTAFCCLRQLFCDRPRKIHPYTGELHFRILVKVINKAAYRKGSSSNGTISNARGRGATNTPYAIS